MSPSDRIKLFAIANQLAENELDQLEKKFQLDLGRDTELGIDRDEDYYPQFTSAIRHEAASMASHYELFYCLESSMRGLIEAKMKSEHGTKWWDQVPDAVKQAVNRNMERELDSAVSQRSEREIDYTTFGELGDIVRQNWSVFSDTFNSRRGFDKVMAVLNVLRGPIAHCSPLAPDEVVRLKLAIADWFRLMS